MTDEFKEYQKQIRKNALALAIALSNKGFRLVAGGTDTHLMLLDMTPKGMSGKKAERLLEEAGITTNKNTIPFDTRKPFITSGVRIGTPAVTTRGMKEPEMEIIAEFIARVIDNPDDEGIRQEVKKAVFDLCKRFPLYANRLDPDFD